MNNTQGILFSIIIVFTYVKIIYSDISMDLSNLITNMLGVIIIPAIISFFIFKKHNYGTRLFWCTLVLCVLSGIGQKI